MGKSQAYRLIDSAEVVNNIIEAKKSGTVRCGAHAAHAFVSVKETVPRSVPHRGHFLPIAYQSTDYTSVLPIP